jgi:D-arabinose 1-dehydrogenase-like Zn-dependent alcohol dehydrogenase
MASMKVMQISRPGGDFEFVERSVPEPGDHQVRIKVEACGICHSDSLTKNGYWPGIEYPRVPGHEVAGRIDAVGPDVSNWTVGQRVGVGWHGGHCFVCDPCRRGNFIHCERAAITGITMDGGYSEYMIARAEAVAAIPEDLSAADAAPLMCAGITVFNALRNSGAVAGDVVAVQGIGGLGHLGIQYARQMGFRTVAIARRKDKEQLAKKLGAQLYIDTETENVAEELTRLGGARVVLATAPDAKAMSPLIEAVGPDGKLLIVGAPAEPFPVSALPLIGGKRSIVGWASGTAMDSQDTLRFSAQSGVRPVIETFPLSRAAEAYERMMTGKARFRAVLTMAS